MQSPHTRLYLKGEFHGFFQRGIPGLTGSIDETASWIEAVIRTVKPTRLRLIGFGAAAYAAILFGHLLAADAIYAFAPEVLLGLPQYRSARWFPAGFHPVYRDLRPLLPALRDRLAILYPAYEPIEFRMLRWVLDAGVENVALGVDFHPGGLAVALDRMMAAEETPIAATSLTRVLHPGRYDFAAIERIATAYETWMEGDIALAETLLRAALADDPRNYGFMCHLAVHRGLQGDLAATEALLRTALEGMVGDYGPYGREVARHAKSVLRGFYEPSRRAAPGDRADLRPAVPGRGRGCRGGAGRQGMTGLDLHGDLPWIAGAALLALLVAIALLWRRRARHAGGIGRAAPRLCRGPGWRTGRLRPHHRPRPPRNPLPRPPNPSSSRGGPSRRRSTRYLFPDLRAIPETGPHLARHFLNHGKHEIAGRKRFAAPDRLLAIELQQLSPLAPGAAPADHWRFIPGEGDTLDIMCSHAAPDGEFGPTIRASETQGARLFLKCRHHDFYQGGIPGLAGSIDDTARWIAAVIARVKPRRIRTIGFSVGGYAAILFGHLLSADVIYACGAELALGAPQYPSARWYPEQVYDPAYRDLRPFLPRLRGRIALFYPAYDPIAFRAIQAAREAGLDNLGLVTDFHPGVFAVPLPPLLQAEGLVLPVARTGSSLHRARYDDAAVERIATAYEALADGGLARSEPLLERALAEDGLNFGFMCHLGVHRALGGDLEAAERMIRAGLAGILLHAGPGAADTARHARTLARSSYRPTREQLRATEMIFDRVFRDLAGQAVQQGGSAA